MNAILFRAPNILMVVAVGSMLHIQLLSVNINKTIKKMSCALLFFSLSLSLETKRKKNISEMFFENFSFITRNSPAIIHQLLTCSFH